MTIKNLKEIDKQVKNIENLKANNPSYQLSEETEIIDLFRYILSVDKDNEMGLNEVVVTAKKLKKIFKTTSIEDQCALLYAYINHSDIMNTIEDDDLFYIIKDDKDAKGYHYYPYEDMDMSFHKEGIKWNKTAFALIKKNLASLQKKYNIE